MANICDHEGNGACEGAVLLRSSLSGASDWYRCLGHQEAYEVETSARLEKVNEDWGYQDSPFAPAWFDPTYAGERWDEDY